MHNDSDVGKVATLDPETDHDLTVSRKNTNRPGPQ